MPGRPDRTAEVTVVPETKKERPTVELNGYVLETDSVTSRGKTYTFRELTVGENDLCRDAATSPEDVYDGREMMRMMIITAAIDPEMKREDLTKIPSRLYAKMVDIVNTLNDPDTLEVDPGNS